MIGLAKLVVVHFLRKRNKEVDFKLTEIYVLCFYCKVIRLHKLIFFYSWKISTIDEDAHHKKMPCTSSFYNVAVANFIFRRGELGLSLLMGLTS